jgi:hypothetical protein
MTQCVISISEWVQSPLPPIYNLAHKLKAAGIPVFFNGWNVNLRSDEVTIERGTLTRTEIPTGIQFDWEP